MKSISTLIKGARLIVEDCMGVQKGDKVLVIADEEHMLEAKCISGVAVSLGAKPLFVDATPKVTDCLASTEAPMEPADHLAAAMVNSDVIIITTNLEWANRFAHVNSVKKSCEAGAKIASVEEGMDRWNLTRKDIEKTMETTRRIIEAMAGAKWARITAPNGTDVRICIEGRRALSVVPVKGKGHMMGPIPLWGEVAYAAVEDKSEGRVVIDGIMLGIGVPGSLNNPIEWIVKAGRAVEIRGGEEAAKLKEVIKGSDKFADVLGEFAIGTSEKEVYGSPSEKGLLGTVHFALGDNAHAYPGGKNYSKLHLDGTVRNVTIEADGKIIIERGALKV